MSPFARAAAFALLLAPVACAHGVLPQTPRAQRRAQDPRRAEAAVYAAAMDHGGGAAARLGRPLWLSEHWLAGQLDVSAAAVVAMHRAVRGRMLAITGATFGAHLYLASWFSMELRLGLATGFSAGSGGGVALFGLLGGGGYVFHPFRDHRIRWKIDLLFAPLGALTRRPTDCPLCAGLLGVGVAFEAPL